MNEGCDGGWSIFHGFFAENAGIMTEECVPYKGRTKGHSCAEYKNCKPYAKVTKSYYVNGYNFSPTEMQIRKEMLMYGPVTTEFKCNDDFQVYQEGIMQQGAPVPEKITEGQVNAQKGSSKGSLSNSTAQTNSTSHANTTIKANSTIQANATQQVTAAPQKNISLVQEDITVPNVDDREYVETESRILQDDEPFQTLAQSGTKMATQQLDHTIFLVGWGFDKQKNLPYWIVRNSYGDTWGMRGDFHVRRGKDDFGIESELSGYHLELMQDN